MNSNINIKYIFEYTFIKRFYGHSKRRNMMARSMYALKILSMRMKDNSING